MMTGNKGGGDIELCDIMPGDIIIFVNFIGRTSQVGAAHMMISLTPAEAPTHLLPGHAGVGAGVLRHVANILTVLVGVITSRPYRGVTGRGLGKLPTFIAAYNFAPSAASGAGIPGPEAAVLISEEGLEAARSA